MIWRNIVLDFRQPVSYLIPAAIVATFIMLFYRVCTKKKMRISCILLIIYGEVLFQTAFLSREPGSRKGIDIDLFATWGNTSIAHAYFIENILMFIPFGVLVPIVFPRMQKLQWCLLAGFLCSCGIELLQLITQRGYCQLDDVVTNTVGTLLGWLICTGWKMSKRRLLELFGDRYPKM